MESLLCDLNVNPMLSRAAHNISFVLQGAHVMGGWDEGVSGASRTGVWSLKTRLESNE